MIANLVGRVLALVSVAVAFGASAKTYEANWESLNTRPCPEWWKNAKFGIFVHWGTYSVPAFAPYDKNSVYGCYAEHYGNPQHQEKYPAIPTFHAKHYPNKSYIDFAAEFTAENFDPAAWAELFKRSGAKYVVLTSKHHEGFALWPSAQSPYYNAAGCMGPKRDLCGDLTEAVRAAGLHMGFYYSLLEWRHPLYNKDDIRKFVDRVNIPQLKDLVVRYNPEIVWTDGEWDYPWQVWRGPEFLAWLYNESPVKDTVVVNDRWGKGFRGKCGDHYTTEYEDLTKESQDSAQHPWEECRGIGLSFGYNKFETTAQYLSNEACIETLCDKVSRGGNLLLNIGPTSDGLIPVIMEERLLAIGKWLSVNGEAIYGTTAWEKRPKDMKENRVYFTKKGEDLYAIVFGSSEKAVVPDCGFVKSVSLLGGGCKIKWTQKGRDVEIEMPAFRQGEAPAEHAIVFRLSGMVSVCSIQREIDEAAERGGGRVVVPAGEHFIDGPLHLRSNVELHLEDGAMLVFTDNPAKYLPAVPSSWEGLECLNYSPLVYAYCCTNVAITGKGTLAPKMDRWAAQMERERQTWTSPEKDPRYDIQAARAILYKWGSEDYPVEKRDMTKAHPAVMRPQLVQFNRCKGVRVEDVRIRDCPFWTIHLFLSEDVVVRGVDSRARGFNNDGIDIEMSRNILVENCRFDQGDDGIVLKAGRNRDAWRLNRPTENIVVRNCDFAFAHSLLGIGSELSGGICNVWMHHCKIGSAYNLFYVKTNRRRGGFVKNINFGDVECDNIRGALCRVETDVLYQWAKFPDYELRRTEIDGLHIRNVKANCADYAIDIRGDAAAPVRNVELENVWLGSFRKAFERVENATDICKENVRCGGLEPKSWDQPVSVNAKGKSK